MSDCRNNRPHQAPRPGAPPQLYGSSAGYRAPAPPQQNLLGSNDFPRSYPAAGSYVHQPEQPPNRVQGHVEGYPPEQQGYLGSYHQSQPPQSASPLPLPYGSSHQHNHVHQPGNNSSTQGHGSSNTYRQGQPPVLGAPQVPDHLLYEEANLPEKASSARSHQSSNNYLQQQPPLSGAPPVQGHSQFKEAYLPENNLSTETYQSSNHYQQPQAPQPRAPRVQGHRHYDEVNLPKNYPSTQSYQSSDNYHARQPPVLGVPLVQGHLNIGSEGWDSQGHITPYKEQQPSTSASSQPPPQTYPSPGCDGEDENPPVAYPVNDYHQPVVRTNPNINAASSTPPSRQPIMQPQPQFTPPTPTPSPPPPNAFPPPTQVPPPQPPQQHARRPPTPPDGYPTGSTQPSPKPDKSRCCCTIL